MKKARILFLLLAGVLLLAGCQKEGKIGGKDAIRFKASANPGTKTEYTGVYDGGIERIYWNMDDPIRIFSNKAEHRYHEGQHWADYQITEILGNGDKANINNVPGDGTGNGLVWDLKGDYEFYAIYPNLESDEGKLGVLKANIPDEQEIDVTATIPSTPMKYAVMTAFQKMTTTVDGEGGDINLEFSPAFTAFEFTFNSDIPLKVSGFKLFSADDAPAIAGDFEAIYTDGVLSYDFSDASGHSVEAFFSEGFTIDERTPFTFTVFALPNDLSGLGIKFIVQNEEWPASEVRTLRLNYKNGDPVQFAGGVKHRITGTMQGTWNFKYITLEGVAAEWDEEDIELVSDKLPQATQFAVSGVSNIYDLHRQDDAFKDDRQTWILGDQTAKVSFKVFSPLGGSYKVKPYVLKANGTIEEGEGGFVVTGNLSGNLASNASTKVQFTVAAGTASAGDKLFFKTFVTSQSGVSGTVYNIDSETQLYDMRGYHYFQISE